MKDIWKYAKRVTLLFSALAIALWGALLVMAFFDGNVEGWRAGLKLCLVLGVLTWLYDWWQALDQK